MKVLTLSALLIVGLSGAVPAFASTPVYNSKANSPALSFSCNCNAGSSADSTAMVFDGRSTNSKLGSTITGSSSVDVMPATFRAECTKCST
jgi:hypothetical protein